MTKLYKLPNEESKWNILYDVYEDCLNILYDTYICYFKTWIISHDLNLYYFQGLSLNSHYLISQIVNVFS